MIRITFYCIIVAVSLSACGISAGGVVVGTTGYLAEVNRGKAQEAKAPRQETVLARSR